MTLQKLLSKNRFIIVGLNSGTSADGLDLAAIRFDFAHPRRKIEFLVGKAVPFPTSLRSDINKAISNKLDTIDDIIATR